MYETYRPRSTSNMQPDPTAHAHAAPLDRLCQYGGNHCPPAEVFDVDGCWCTPEHRDYDRQSEITWWTAAVA